MAVVAAPSCSTASKATKGEEELLSPSLLVSLPLSTAVVRLPRSTAWACHRGTHQPWPEHDAGQLWAGSEPCSHAGPE